MITKEDIRSAAERLERYREGRSALDSRVLENRRIWNKLTQSTSFSGEETETHNTTAWLFSIVANKHADAMDAYPEAIVTGREEGDIEKAKTLSDILPIICEHNGYAGLWSELWWSKLIDGTCVTGVFWDNSLCRGLGDIALRQVDVLSLFWEPGIRDIQASHDVFSVESMQNSDLIEKYPFLEGKLGNEEYPGTRYAFDEIVDSSERSSVINWYYRKNGKLHFCKFVGDDILYASENDVRFADRGWYDHGNYPFIFDTLYPTGGGICGFGLVDVCKNSQKYIDKLNSAIVKNALNSSKVRYFVRSDGGVNEEEFADTSNELIHVSSSALGEDSIRQIVNHPLSGIYPTVLQMKIDELKETVGNREFNQGGTYGGVTSGTAIAMLQEAGNKLSRDIIDVSYRAFEKMNYMMIELLRQFYSEARSFRILGPDGVERYMRFDNAGIRPEHRGRIFGLEEVIREPIFDVRVFAQKASPISREVKNERAYQFYTAGFFKPEMRKEAIAALEMMDFDGREKVLRGMREEEAKEEREKTILPASLILAEMQRKDHTV